MDRIEKLKEFIAADPTDNFSKHALALEYIKLGEDKIARTFFEEILQQDPAYIGTYYHLGKLYERRNEKELAEKTYKEGMNRTQGKELHTYSELQQAMNQLLYDEE